jgi:hypothetical protein
MNELVNYKHDLLGEEFDWIAKDRHGNFGYFSTGGEGWIPYSVTAKPEPFWESLEIVTSLPIVGEPICTFFGNHAIQEWLEVAARGIFAFDWNRFTKRYELVARPAASVILEGQPSIQALTEPALLPCSFAEDFPPYRTP